MIMTASTSMPLSSNFTVVLESKQKEVIHEEEEALLKTVQIAFDIDETTHQQLLNQAILDPINSPEYEAYRSVLSTALIDGIITNDEAAMLETLRQQTGISEQEHATMLAELQDANEG